MRYHDPNNWPLLREALKEMGRSDLIGNSKQHLIPTYQPQGTAEGEYKSARKRTQLLQVIQQSVVKRNQPQSGQKRPQKGQILTQHTGLPPRETGDKNHSQENQNLK